MSELKKSDEQNLDQSYEYSVINATFDITSDNNTSYYPKQAESNKLTTSIPGVTNNAYNNDYVQVNIKKNSEQSSSYATNSSKDSSNGSSPTVPVQKPAISAKPHIPISRIITNPMIHQAVAKPDRSDYDKLPPQIEISLYGSETLPEGSLTDGDSLTRMDSNDKTPLTTLQVKGRMRSRNKNRYESISSLTFH